MRCKWQPSPPLPLAAAEQARPPRRGTSSKAGGGAGGHLTPREWMGRGPVAVQGAGHMGRGGTSEVGGPEVSPGAWAGPEITC